MRRARIRPHVRDDSMTQEPSCVRKSKADPPIRVPFHSPGVTGGKSTVASADRRLIDQHYLLPVLSADPKGKETSDFRWLRFGRVCEIRPRLAQTKILDRLMRARERVVRNGNSLPQGSACGATRRLIVMAPEAPHCSSRRLPLTHPYRSSGSGSIRGCGPFSCDRRCRN